MKKTILGLSLGLAVLAGATARADHGRVATMTNTSVLDLGRVRDSHLRLDIPYPGMISGVCGLEIRVDNLLLEKPASRILDNLKIEGMRLLPTRVSVRNAVTIDIAYRDIGAYVHWIDIETKDGSPIGAAVQRALGTDGIVRKAILLGKSCGR